MSIKPGEVTTVSPVKVKLYGSDSDAPANHIGSYTPVQGDRVAVETQYGTGTGSQLLILGLDVAS